jgi:hypothetical protein
MLDIQRFKPAIKPFAYIKGRAISDSALILMTPPDAVILTKSAHSE